MGVGAGFGSGAAGERVTVKDAYQSGRFVVSQCQFKHKLAFQSGPEAS